MDLEDVLIEIHVQGLLFDFSGVFCMRIPIKDTMETKGRMILFNL